MKVILFLLLGSVGTVVVGDVPEWVTPVGTFNLSDARGAHSFLFIDSEYDTTVAWVVTKGLVTSLWGWHSQPPKALGSFPVSLGATRVVDVWDGSDKLQHSLCAAAAEKDIELMVDGTVLSTIHVPDGVRGLGHRLPVLEGHSQWDMLDVAAGSGGLLTYNITDRRHPELVGVLKRNVTGYVGDRWSHEPLLGWEVVG